MLGLMGFSGSLPLYVIHRYYIFVFIDRANKDACLLACLLTAKLIPYLDFGRRQVTVRLSTKKNANSLSLKVV